MGTVLFSGSLYHRGLTDKKTFSGVLTPFGGVSMIIGWILLALRK
jgi:uncharacterized membrane protein YgdD (TMEM256/DUF423 family)